MSMLDEHLEHHVSQLLLADDAISSQRITVVAKNGTVTLVGRVQSFRRKLAAQKIAEADTNVSVVYNELVVESTDGNSDVAIASKVNRKLDAATDLTGEAIRVDVKAGTVTLTGYVGTELKKLRSADISAAIDGVREVNNMLVVNPGQVAANQEHALTILESMSSIIGMENERVRVSVVDEMARLSGDVDSPWKKEKAEEVVGQYGVMHIANEIVVKEE